MTTVLLVSVCIQVIYDTYTRFAGKQYTEFEMLHSPGNKRKYGAINRGTMYEIAQGYAGADTSPMPVFFSRGSDTGTTVICKKMAAHPIICECPYTNSEMYL